MCLGLPLRRHGFFPLERYRHTQISTIETATMVSQKRADEINEKMARVAPVRRLVFILYLSCLLC